jgi:acyl-CoA synthetase (NDP forming)
VTESTTPTRDYTPLFAPASIAVVGASGDPAKWGYWLARGALEGRHRREVRLVNRHGEPVLGEPTYTSLRDLPDVPELVAISVPAAGFEAVVDEALALGVKALVGITAGISPDDAARLTQRIRAAGAVLLGPNCMGVADAHAGLRLVWGDLPAGRIGLLSQSGNLAIELGWLARRDGLGFSRFASLGNEADVSAADLLETVAADPGTDVVALYVEDFRRVRDLAESAQRISQNGTPVVLLAAGRGEVARRAAASHTGAMAGSRAAVEAACTAAGITLVDTPSALIEVAHALSASAAASLAGSRVAVVADGGGHGVVASDLLEASSFTLPTLGDKLQADLAATLPTAAVTTNPIDLAGGGEQDHRNYARMVATVLASGDIDAAILTGYFGGYGIDEPRLADREADVAREICAAVLASGRPALVHSVAPDGPTAAVLREGGVPVLRRIEGAVAGLAALRTAAIASGVPAVPADAGPTPDGDAYLVGRELLAAAGVEFPKMRAVDSTDAAVQAAQEIGFPVVLKALDLAHKSDVGGVKLNLTTAADVVAAYDDVIARLGQRPVVVEAMAPIRGPELIVGARHDDAAGPLVLVGLGGVQAEVLGDVVVRLGPVDEAGAIAMLQQLRSYRLLTGFRGTPTADLHALARVIATVSRVLAERPDLHALEVNPVVATPDGAIGLDVHLERA